MANNVLHNYIYIIILIMIRRNQIFYNTLGIIWFFFILAVCINIKKKNCYYASHKSKARLNPDFLRNHSFLLVVYLVLDMPKFKINLFLFVIKMSMEIGHQ